MANIFVLVEQEGDGPTTLCLELLAKARTLGKVTAVYVGTGAGVDVLGEHGAARVLQTDPGDRLPASASQNRNILVPSETVEICDSC